MGAIGCKEDHSFPAWWKGKKVTDLTRLLRQSKKKVFNYCERHLKRSGVKGC